MSGLLHLLALKGVALVGFAAAAAVLAALAHPAVAARARALPPALRSRALLAWAAAPAGLASALLALALWPSLGAALGLAVDHCPVHAGHVHLCLHHLPEGGPGIVAGAGLAALAAAAVAGLLRGIRAALVARRLRGATSLELPSGVGLVASPRPFALAVGWLRPRVLVSTALFEHLPERQVQVVLAHERAHAARRDALAVAAARVLAWAHLPSVRRRIVADLTLACEEACDEAAARECGDPLLVAETIVAAERAAGAVAPASPALAFGGGEVEARVESLLAPPATGAVPRRLGWVLLAAAAALGAAAPRVHHWTETALHHLLR